MSSKLAKSVVAAALATGLLTGVANAYQAGDWVVRGGIWGAFPKSDNLSLPLGTVEVDDGVTFGFNITHMITPNLGVELLGAWPFSHDIKLGGRKVGETKHLPPTVTMQYHFLPQNTVRPYVGLGLNYTFFFDEGTTGALTGTKLSLKDSWGLAAQAGVDIDITPDWFVNLDVHYIDIDTKAKVNGASLGTVEIDPWVVGINIGTRF